MRSNRTLNLLTLFSLLCSLVAQAKVTLPAVIDHHMVLQRQTLVPIWGWADAGESVTVEFDGQTQRTTADASGKWMVHLDPMEANSSGRNLTIRATDTVTLNDVLVGEVWLASGQSNMEWTFAQCAPEEWSYAQEQKANAQLRAFHVDQHLQAGVPLDDTIGRWRTCADILSQPQSISSVGFFFALKLQQELGIPVAIIDSNWGGQAIERFIPKEGYAALGLNLQQHWVQTDLNLVAQQMRAHSAALNRAAEAAEQGRRIAYPSMHHHSSSQNFIYNAMIAPVVPYGLRGAIWYQGESNRHSRDYFTKLQALSAGWSEVFNVPNMPIYQVQIAPYKYNRGAERETMLCDHIWRAQYRGATEIAGMGIVAVHDTNINILDIHPKHKRPVGERLAAQALHYQYGKDVVTRGPSLADARLDGASVVLSFQDVDEGLVTSDGAAPSWFELSADGHSFLMGEAVIEGDLVRVRHAQLQEPKFVRMGWDESAIPNLRDGNGWPVFAFPATPVR